VAHPCPHMKREALPVNPHPPAFPSPEDAEDAEDILFAHPSRQVTRQKCACGEEYPCAEVRLARLVKDAVAGAAA
jgi:hypothetical protein